MSYNSICSSEEFFFPGVLPKPPYFSLNVSSLLLLEVSFNFQILIRVSKRLNSSRFFRHTSKMLFLLWVGHNFSGPSGLKLIYIVVTNLSINASTEYDFFACVPGTNLAQIFLAILIVSTLPLFYGGLHLCQLRYHG